MTKSLGNQQGQPAGGRLRLHVLASGSKGNCSIVQDTATGQLVVVDCGISFRAFQERVVSV